MQQRRILWLAIVASTVIYMVILYILHKTPPPTSFDEAVRNPMVLGLYGIALLNFAIGLFAFGSLKERDPKAGMMIRLALFESSAIFGLLAAFLNQDWRLYLPAWAVALIGFMREWPSE